MWWLLYLLRGRCRLRPLCRHHKASLYKLLLFPLKNELNGNLFDIYAAQMLVFIELH